MFHPSMLGTAKGPTSTMLIWQTFHIAMQNICKQRQWRRIYQSSLREISIPNIKLHYHTNNNNLVKQYCEMLFFLIVLKVWMKTAKVIPWATVLFVRSTHFPSGYACLELNPTETSGKEKRLLYSPLWYQFFLVVACQDQSQISIPCSSAFYFQYYLHQFQIWWAPLLA